MIWDNRFGADEIEKPKILDGTSAFGFYTPTQVIDRTTF